jgi:hypothetical protein
LPHGGHCVTISAMAVTYEVLDVTYPYVSAIYECPCGKHVVRHAADAGSPPPDWEAMHAGDDDDFICPGCARRRAEGHPPPR